MCTDLSSRTASIFVCLLLVIYTNFIQTPLHWGCLDDKALTKPSFFPHKYFLDLFYCMDRCFICSTDQLTGTGWNRSGKISPFMHHTGIYYALFVYKKYYQNTYSVYTCKTVRKSEHNKRIAIL